MIVIKKIANGLFAMGLCYVIVGLIILVLKKATYFIKINIILGVVMLIGSGILYLYEKRKT
jgi:hypothetical protein